MFFSPNSDPTSESLSRNRDSSDQATFFQSSIVQFCWVCVNYILRVLFLSDRSGTRCDLLLLESICFRVRRVVCSEMVFCIPWLYRVVIWVTVVFLSSLTVCPFSSDINKAFSSTQLPLTGYFLVFGPFSVNPRDGCAWKSQEADQSVWHQQPFHIRSHLNPFLPRSDARFEPQQVIFTTSRCLNALSCCHVNGWLAICVTKQLNRST